MGPKHSYSTHEYRSFVVLDIEGSSERQDPEVMKLRTLLYDVTNEALERSAIARTRLAVEDRGDGIMILVEPAVSKVDLIDPMLGYLVRALAGHNESRPYDDWVRVRIALHAGEVGRDGDGWGSEALTWTFRLVSAPVIKETLAAASRAQCLVVVSDDVYRAVVRHGHRSIDPAHYAEVDIDGTPAWVWIPGYPVPPVPSPGWPGPSLAASAAALLTRGRGGGGALEALLHGRFAGDPVASEQLGAVRRLPHDPAAEHRLAATIGRLAARDPRFEADLARLVGGEPPLAAGSRTTINAHMIKQYVDGGLNVGGDLTIN